jgi:predicted enzyme related to lactoylglutathione lyase
MEHQVIHFEIPATDVARLQRFYSDLFGWKIEAAPGMPDYLMVTTGAQGGPGINGGIMKRQHPQQTLINYVQVESVHRYAEKLKSLGGQIVVPKMAVPKMGYFAVGLDPDNNAVGLWETDPDAA